MCIESEFCPAPLWTVMTEDCASELCGLGERELADIWKSPRFERGWECEGRTTARLRKFERDAIAGSV